MRYLLIGICFLALCACPEGENKEQEARDTDGDGWTDAYEEKIGTNPFGEDLDSDKDGVPDALEQRLGTNEHNPDSDGDGIPDGKEDSDGDGLPTDFELEIGSDPGDNGSDNNLPDGFDDQDGDGLIDYLEFSMGTDPFKTDTDGDGIDDLDESNDPDLDGANSDSDGDGIKDGEDPFVTPKGCTEKDSGVTHGYASCIDGKVHHLTVRYYIRRCVGEADQVVTMVEKDVATDVDCNDEPTEPPPLEEVQG